MSVEQKGCALLTGAAGGMGTAIATALVAAGHPVVLVDRDTARLDALAKSLGGKTTTLVLDITDGPKVAALPSMIPDAFKPIDILINNAGHDIGGRKRFDIGSADDWAAIVDTNLKGAFFCARAAGKIMAERGGGAIVNLCSLTSFVGIPTAVPYGASKTGLLGITRALATEWAPHGIRVNAIAPGYFRTAMTEVFYDDDAWQQRMLAKIPQGRFGGEGETLYGVGSLASASPWKKIVVLLAGPLMNLLLAFVIFGGLFAVKGVPDTGAWIEKVSLGCARDPSIAAGRAETIEARMPSAAPTSRVIGSIVR